MGFIYGIYKKNLGTSLSKTKCPDYTSVTIILDALFPLSIKHKYILKG